MGLWRNAFCAGGLLLSVLGRPGGDLLSHVLGRSTIGAEGFHGRVRDGIGCRSPRHNHQVVAEQITGDEVLNVIEAEICNEALIAACDGAGSSRTSD